MADKKRDAPRVLKERVNTGKTPDPERRDGDPGPVLGSWALRGEGEGIRRSETRREPITARVDNATGGKSRFGEILHDQLC